LDGFIADQQHGLEWLFQFDPVEATGFPDFFKEVGALAMGSNTFEWILRHLPSWPYQLPAWVFTSRQLTAAPEADVRFVRGDVGSIHEQMSAEAGDRNIWIVGGGELVGQFYDAGLLDEIIVQIAAVTLGSGAPLLPRRITSPPLRLTSVLPIGRSFAELRYDVPKESPRKT